MNLDTLLDHHCELKQSTNTWDHWIPKDNTVLIIQSDQIKAIRVSEDIEDTVEVDIAHPVPDADGNTWPIYYKWTSTFPVDAYVRHVVEDICGEDDLDMLPEQEWEIQNMGRNDA